MAITNAQQYKQLVNPPMKGKKRPGYRGDAAAASAAASGNMGGRSDPGPQGDVGDGAATGAQSRGVLDAKRAFQKAQKDLAKSLTQQSRQAAFDKALSFLPGGKRSLFGMGVRGLTNIFGGAKFGKTTAANLADRYGYGPDYQGTKGPSSIDDDDGTGEGEGIPLYARLGFPSQAAYLASLQPQAPAGLPAAVQPQQTMDLNRIAYRLMADGGFLGEEDEPRQAYGLGSLVKKVVKKATTLPRKLIKTVKKVAKSPTGRLLLAVAAPYALGPAVAQSQFLAGLSAAKKAALISGATTGITQLASGEDLDLKDIAVSAALGGASAKMFPPGGAPKADPTGVAGRARVASDISAGAIPDRAMGQIASRASTFTGPAELGMTTRSIKPSAFTSADALREAAGATITPTPEKTGILQTLKDFGTKVKDSKLTDVLLRNEEGKISPMKSILLASALSGLAAKKDQEPDEFSEMDRGPGIDIASIRRRPFDFMAPRFAGSEFDFYAAEGGQAKKEPVAKKVMPLLDMGGMEKDYRKDGGFVPIGRMEKADDVPARLSKNEFVFTADAVRNAGDGNVDKGAEVMYNMMKNLEAGGDVSKESQGLKGAKRMFQTSQRLEEVL